MNRRMLNKMRKFAINHNRLDDNREQYPIEWLLKDTSGSGYINNLERIKESILCMYIWHPNYKTLSDEDKQKANILIDNWHIVDTVLLTTFQWFGTTVGKYEIGKLLDEIRKLNYEKKEIQ